MNNNKLIANAYAKDLLITTQVHYKYDHDGYTDNVQIKIFNIGA